MSLRNMLVVKDNQVLKLREDKGEKDRGLMKDQAENKGSIDKEVIAEIEIEEEEVNNVIRIVMIIHEEEKMKVKRKREKDNIQEVEVIVLMEVKTKTKILAENILGVKVTKRTIKSTINKSDQNKSQNTQEKAIPDPNQVQLFLQVVNSEVLIILL